MTAILTAAATFAQIKSRRLPLELPNRFAKTAPARLGFPPSARFDHRHQQLDVHKNKTCGE